MVSALTSGSGPDLIGQLSTTRWRGRSLQSVRGAGNLAKMRKAFILRNTATSRRWHCPSGFADRNQQSPRFATHSVMVLSLPSVDAAIGPPLPSDAHTGCLLQKPSLLLDGRCAPCFLDRYATSGMHVSEQIRQPRPPARGRGSAVRHRTRPVALRNWRRSHRNSSWRLGIRLRGPRFTPETHPAILNHRVHRERALTGRKTPPAHRRAKARFCRQSTYASHRRAAIGGSLPADEHQHDMGCETRGIVLSDSANPDGSASAGLAVSGV